jgi:hypothetical protein
MHDVFISYSRRNIAFARRLEKDPREYKPPRDVSVPQRYLDVFRDEADFAPDYFQSIERHLRTRRSPCHLLTSGVPADTSMTIRHFARARGAENIVPVLRRHTTMRDRRNRSAVSVSRRALRSAEMPLTIPYSGFDAKKKDTS